MPHHTMDGCLSPSAKNIKLQLALTPAPAFSLKSWEHPFGM